MDVLIGKTHTSLSLSLCLSVSVSVYKMVDDSSRLLIIHLFLKFHLRWFNPNLWWNPMVFVKSRPFGKINKTESQNVIDIWWIPWFLWSPIVGYLPCGKRWHSDGKSQCLMGKLTFFYGPFSMAILNSQRVSPIAGWFRNHGTSHTWMGTISAGHFQWLC